MCGAHLEEARVAREHRNADLAALSDGDGRSPNGIA
jgi:hypothetical protein